MRFLCFYKPTKPEGTPPTHQEMAEMGKLIEESMKSGELLATEGCLPSTLGARIRLSGGKFNVIDGPFTESKELVAGFALIQTKSKEAAIEYVKKFLNVAGDGESEIRQKWILRRPSCEKRLRKIRVTDLSIFEKPCWPSKGGEVSVRSRSYGSRLQTRNFRSTTMRFMMLMIPEGYAEAQQARCLAPGLWRR
jgi:hypothetical protein